MNVFINAGLYLLIPSPFSPILLTTILSSGNHQNFLCIYDLFLFSLFVSFSLFFISRISGIIWYLPLWLSAVHLIPSRPILVVAEGKISFSLWVSRILFSLCTISAISSSVHVHLGCFCILDVVNNPSLNKGMHISVWITIFGFFVWIARSGTAGSFFVSFYITFVWMSNLVKKDCYPSFLLLFGFHLEPKEWKYLFPSLQFQSLYVFQCKLGCVVGQICQGFVLLHSQTP